MKAKVNFSYTIEVELPDRYENDIIETVKDRNDIIKYLEKTGQLPIFLREKEAKLTSIVDEINDEIIYKDWRKGELIYDTRR